MTMTRRYELKRRAALQNETRQRIVDATIERQLEVMRATLLAET